MFYVSPLEGYVRWSIEELSLWYWFIEIRFYYFSMVEYHEWTSLFLLHWRFAFETDANAAAASARDFKCALGYLGWNCSSLTSWTLGCLLRSSFQKHSPTWPPKAPGCHSWYGKGVTSFSIWFRLVMTGWCFAFYSLINS